MNFLDESGLKKLWTKIKASFGTAIVVNSECSNNRDSKGRIMIPFVANHQIISFSLAGYINVYDWFQKASIGGILEVVIEGAQGGATFCETDNKSRLYQMRLPSAQGPRLTNIESVPISYNSYIRLIKTNDNILLVAADTSNKA